MKDGGHVSTDPRRWLVLAQLNTNADERRFQQE
jgi:hypothetical protein